MGKESGGRRSSEIIDDPVESVHRDESDADRTGDETTVENEENDTECSEEERALDGPDGCRDVERLDEREYASVRRHEENHASDDVLGGDRRLPVADRLNDEETPSRLTMKLRTVAPNAGWAILVYARSPFVP